MDTSPMTRLRSPGSPLGLHLNRLERCLSCSGQPAHLGDIPPTTRWMGPGWGPGFGSCRRHSCWGSFAQRKGLLPMKSPWPALLYSPTENTESPCRYFLGPVLLRCLLASFQGVLTVYQQPWGRLAEGPLHPGTEGEERMEALCVCPVQVFSKHRPRISGVCFLCVH